MGVWLQEFRTFAAERAAGTGDRLPNLSMVRLPNDHTDGIGARKPTPQFYVADNDYALGTCWSKRCRIVLTGKTLLSSWLKTMRRMDQITSMRTAQWRC